MDSRGRQMERRSEPLEHEITTRPQYRWLYGANSRGGRYRGCPSGIRQYAVSMNSGTRQVVRATDDAMETWMRVQEIWDQAARQDRKMVLDTRESFNELVGGAQRAAENTRRFKKSMMGLREFAQREVDEALTAQDSAIDACESVAELGRTVVEVLSRSLDACITSGP